MISVSDFHPSLNQKAIRYCRSIAIYPIHLVKSLVIVRSFLKVFDKSFYLLVFNTFSSDLCGSKPACIRTNQLIELASKPPNTTINSEEDMGPIVAGYARVSSREQAEDTNALVQQKTRLTEAGATYIFCDIQKGKKDNRPQFQELMRLVKAGKIRTLIITRIDRVSRSLPTLRKLAEELQKHNVNFIVIDQKIDLSTPQGKLMFNILGTLAEWEVDLLSDRVIHGIEHGRKQGWANGSCPFGLIVIDRKYVKDITPFLCLLTDRPPNYQDFYSTSLVEVDPYQLPHRTVADVARDCIEIYLDKRGVRPALKAIFEKYGVRKTQAKSNGTDRVLHWTGRGFGLWIRNPILDGHTCYGKQTTTPDGKVIFKPRSEWTIIPNTHPDQRLLQDGEAEEIESIFAANQRSGGGTFADQEGSHRLYAYQIGLVYCAECNSRAIKKNVYAPQKDYGYYGCRNAGIGCSNHKNVSRDTIEGSVIEAILLKEKTINQDSVTPKTPFKTNRLKQLEEQLAFLKQFPGFNPGAETCKAEIERQIEAEKQFFESQELEDRTVEDVIRMGCSLGIWHTLSGKEKSLIFRRIIERIYIRDGRVESIVFKGNSALTSLQEDHDAERG